MQAAVSTKAVLYHTKNYQGTTTQHCRPRQASALYHTKNYQGTTTTLTKLISGCSLYHTKNYQGTTTSAHNSSNITTLYHTKNYQGISVCISNTGSRSPGLNPSVKALIRNFRFIQSNNAIIPRLPIIQNSWIYVQFIAGVANHIRCHTQNSIEVLLQFRIINSLSKPVHNS